MCVIEFNKSFVNFFFLLLRVILNKIEVVVVFFVCILLIFCKFKIYLLSYKKFDFYLRWLNYLCNRKLKI